MTQHRQYRKTAEENKRKAPSHPHEIGKRVRMGEENVKVEEVEQSVPARSFAPPQRPACGLVHTQQANEKSKEARASETAVMSQQEMHERLAAMKTETADGLFDTNMELTKYKRMYDKAIKQAGIDLHRAQEAERKLAQYRGQSMQAQPSVQEELEDANHKLSLRVQNLEDELKRLRIEASKSAGSCFSDAAVPTHSTDQMGKLMNENMKLKWELKMMQESNHDLRDLRAQLNLKERLFKEVQEDLAREKDRVFEAQKEIAYQEKRKAEIKDQLRKSNEEVETLRNSDREKGFQRFLDERQETVRLYNELQSRPTVEEVTALRERCEDLVREVMTLKGEQISMLNLMSSTSKEAAEAIYAKATWEEQKKSLKKRIKWLEELQATTGTNCNNEVLVATPLLPPPPPPPVFPPSVLFVPPRRQPIARPPPPPTVTPATTTVPPKAPATVPSCTQPPTPATGGYEAKLVLRPLSPGSFHSSTITPTVPSLQQATVPQSSVSTVGEDVVQVVGQSKKVRDTARMLGFSSSFSSSNPSDLDVVFKPLQKQENKRSQDDSPFIRRLTATEDWKKYQ